VLDRAADHDLAVGLDDDAAREFAVAAADRDVDAATPPSPKLASSSPVARKRATTIARSSVASTPGARKPAL